jgi:outer membrane protein assembly factor BamB
LNKTRFDPAAYLARFLVAVTIILAWAMAVSAPPLRAQWPLLWDGGGSSDDAIAATLGPADRLYVLVRSSQSGTPTVLLCVDVDGSIVWQGVDPGMTVPLGLTVREDGTALVVGSAPGSILRSTAFTASDGALQWSRDRADVSWTPPRFGDPAQPVWSATEERWWIPARKNGEFVVLNYDEAGNSTEDWTWPLPNGEGGASSVRPRAGGGFYVAGSLEAGPLPPGWWTVAVDALGSELWSHFEDGDTPFDTFSNAFLLGQGLDELILWANDETDFGLFSLRLWALDPEDGSRLWAVTWPEDSMSHTETRSVVASGGRVLAAGSTEAFGSTAEAFLLSFDATDGDLVWTSGTGQVGTTEARLASRDGSALLALTQSPVIPGPPPLSTFAWSRDGQSCSESLELLPGRVVATLLGAEGQWWVVGMTFSPENGNDVLIQQRFDPCFQVFGDGFETGDLTRWSGVLP